MRVSPSPIELLEAALVDLAAAVTLRELPGVTTHTAIVADGLESPKATTALGRYLVGALAGAVDIDAELSEAMLATGVDARGELERTVRRLVRDPNVCRSEKHIRFRDTRRNAWIAEGVVHALLVVRARTETSCLEGPVHALTPPHELPTQQGFDAVAIYADGVLPVVAIGESKASRNGGRSQVGEAAIFAQVDDGGYGPHLRSALLSLRRVLPPQLKSQVSDALWREHRCYMPVILHESPFDPVANRKSLGRLAPPVERRRLLALQLKNFHGFFDAIADAMRAAVSEIVV